MVGFQRVYNRINSSEDLTGNLAVTSGRETNPFDDYGIERPIAPIVHLTPVWENTSLYLQEIWADLRAAGEICHIAEPRS